MLPFRLASKYRPGSILLWCTRCSHLSPGWRTQHCLKFGSGRGESVGAGWEGGWASGGEGGREAERKRWLLCDKRPVPSSRAWETGSAAHKALLWRRGNARSSKIRAPIWLSVTRGRPLAAPRRPYPTPQHTSPPSTPLRSRENTSRWSLFRLVLSIRGTDDTHRAVKLKKNVCFFCFFYTILMQIQCAQTAWQLDFKAGIWVGSTLLVFSRS